MRRTYATTRAHLAAAGLLAPAPCAAAPLPHLLGCACATCAPQPRRTRRPLAYGMALPGGAAPVLLTRYMGGPPGPGLLPLRAPLLAAAQRGAW